MAVQQPSGDSHPKSQSLECLTSSGTQLGLVSLAWSSSSLESQVSTSLSDLLRWVGSASAWESSKASPELKLLLLFVDF